MEKVNGITDPKIQHAVAQATRVFKQVLGQTLQRGYHGTIELSLHIQDGVLNHVKGKQEQVFKVDQFKPA